MNRPRSAAELSRRQLLRVLGGLVGATLGIRAVSEHAGAAKYDWGYPCYTCQSPVFPPKGAVRERLKKRR
jgi:hypothetical protein